jgi:hypothetical protein
MKIPRRKAEDFAADNGKLEIEILLELIANDKMSSESKAYYF